MLKNVYFKIEKFVKERPFLFGVIMVIASSIPIVSMWSKIHKVLSNDYSMKGFVIVIIFLIPIVVYILYKIIKPKSFKKNIINELESIKSKLDNPLDVETTDRITGRLKPVKIFFHFEILECFDNYNAIITRIKNKWPKKFEDLKLREDKPNIIKGDWVPISCMQVIKSDVISLIRRIK